MMTEEVTKEVPVVQMNGKKKNPTYAEMNGINMALGQARAHLKNAKGDVVYAISKNLELTGQYMRAFEKKRQEGVKLFAKLDENGKIQHSVLSEEEIKEGKRAEVLFDEGQKEKCEEYMRELLAEEVVMDKPFRTIPYESFKTAVIDLEKFKFIDFFIDTFVVEK